MVGYAAGPHLIQVSVNPKDKGFTENLDRNLSRCIAHEWHHSLRHRSVGYGRTLDEAIVSEGLADRFADQVYGHPPDRWTRAVKKKDVERLFNRAKKEFGKRGYDHNKWFFSNGRRHIPHWTGYSLGYQIVGQFLMNNPNETPASLIDTPAKTILETFDPKKRS